MTKWNYGCLSALLAAAATALLAAPRAAALPIMQFSQDGKHYTAWHLLGARQTAAAYYDYQNQSGSPAFGTAAGTASLASFWDQTRGTLSVMLVAGATGDSGSAAVTLTGLPRGGKLSLADDANQVSYDRAHPTLTGTLQYNDQTSGFVVGHLEKVKWTATLKLAATPALQHVRVVDGDPAAGGQFIELDLAKPIYLRLAGWRPHKAAQASGGATGGAGGTTGAGGGTPVPEPTGLGFVALAAGACLRRRRPQGA